MSEGWPGEDVEFPYRYDGKPVIPDLTDDEAAAFMTAVNGGRELAINRDAENATDAQLKGSVISILNQAYGEQATERLYGVLVEHSGKWQRAVSRETTFTSGQAHAHVQAVSLLLSIKYSAAQELLQRGVLK